MKSALLILFFFILTGPSVSHAQEYVYRDYLTGFSDLSPRYCTPEGFILLDNTDSSHRLIESHAFPIADSDFSYQIRFRDGKERKLRDRLLRQNPPTEAFGIVWNHTDDKNYMAASLSRNTTNLHEDIAAQQTFLLTIEQYSEGEKEILRQYTIDNALNYAPDEYNSLRISYTDGMLSIAAGHRELETIFTSAQTLSSDSCRIGYFTDAGGWLQIKRIFFESKPQEEHLFTSAYTRETLDSIFASSTDPLEGYWMYLDRNTDDNLFVLGGKYIIAIVKTDNGNYDIVYVSGASKYDSLWKPFMLKGRLKRTPFFLQYDLEWNDASKKTFSDETYATLSEQILTLHFPLNKSLVRFYKKGRTLD